LKEMAVSVLSEANFFECLKKEGKAGRKQRK
jgi:hypothetical protein